MRWALEEIESRSYLFPREINTISRAFVPTINMQLLYCTFLFFLALLALLFFRNGCQKTASKQLLPPSPMALPLLGHLHLLGPLLHQSLHAVANRCGPIFHLRLGSSGDTVVVSSPALAKEFLKSHDLAFASRLRLVGQEEYLGGEDCVSFSFLPFGPQWKFLKKLLQTEFLSAKKFDKMAGIRHREMKLFLGFLLEKSRGRERADLEEMLPALTNGIICKTTTSARCLDGKQEAAEEMRKLVREHIELAGKLNIVHLLMGGIAKLDLLGYGKRLKKANERYMEMVEKIIEEREREKQQLKVDEQVDGLDGGEEEEEEECLVYILLKIPEDVKSELKLTRHNMRTLLLVTSSYYFLPLPTLISVQLLIIVVLLLNFRKGFCGFGTNFNKFN